MKASFHALTVLAGAWADALQVSSRSSSSHSILTAEVSRCQAGNDEVLTVGSSFCPTYASTNNLWLKGDGMRQLGVSKENRKWKSSRMEIGNLVRAHLQKYHCKGKRVGKLQVASWQTFKPGMIRGGMDGDHRPHCPLKSLRKINPRIEISLA